MKIAILGYSGAGKSTLAKRLGTIYNIPVLHLDTVQFLPNWQERDRVEAVAIVTEFMKNDQWVIDGNYTCFLQNERLEKATEIIFLDFSRSVCFWSAFKRYIRNKNKTRSDMATGCKEKFDLEFMKWIVFEGRTNKKRNYYKNITNKFKEKTIVLSNRKEVNLYLQNKVKGTHIK